MRFLRPLLVVAGALLFALAGPSWSAADDGVAKTSIVYVNGTNIAVTDAAGTDHRVLTVRDQPSRNDYDCDRSPSIAPDGNRFAFLRDVDGDRGELTKLMIDSLDGSGIHAVTNSLRLAPKAKHYGFSSTIESPSWAPDGSRIFFIQNDKAYWRGEKRWVTRVLSIRPDGSGLKTIIKTRTRYRHHYPVAKARIFKDLDVSADGRKLLVTDQSFSGKRSDIYSMVLKSGRYTRLVRQAEHGRWSPDGKQILFLKYVDNANHVCFEGGCYLIANLYVAGSDGKGARRVLKHKQHGDVFGADWSPDGSRIAFGSDRNYPYLLGGGSEIYSVHPDGSCLTWLTNGSPASYEPDWSPAAGLDSSPEGCGGGDRPAVIYPMPSAELPVTYRPTTLPRFWLGPVFRGSVLSDPTVDGDDLSYYDCASFNLSDCQDIYVSLNSGEICKRGVSDFLEAGRYQGMMRYRGGLFAKPYNYWNGVRQGTLITGGQTITIQLVSSQDKRAPTAEYLDLVDELRPLGHDELVGAELPEAVFDRWDIDRAAYLTRSFSRLKSVPKVARRYRTKKAVVRAYLKFQKDLDKFGPVKSVKCPD